MGCVCKMNKQMNFGSFIFLEGLKLDKTKCRVKNKSIREGLKGFISYSFCKNGSGSFDIPNGLEKLRNLRYCSRNNFSNKIKYKLAKFSRSQFIWLIRFVSSF